MRNPSNHRSRRPEEPQATKPVRYAVHASSHANDHLRQLKTKAFDADGSPKKGSKDLTAYEGARAVVDKVIPEHALNLNFALGTRGGVALGGIYRAKPGRLRVFWIASKERRKAIVLFIGIRKEGDKKDAYAMLEHGLRAGAWDHHFAELGQTNPLAPPRAAVDTARKR